MTFHWACNYGAVIQAYALQEYIKQRYDCEVEIIDYYPDSFRYTLKKAFTPSYPSVMIQRMKEFLRERKIKDFRENLTLSSHYSSTKQLQEYVDQYDLLVCGSDQIWNPSFTRSGEGKLTTAYFLDFGGECKRISYAASFGVNQVSPEQEALIKEMLSKFQLISVREKSGVGILSKIGINAVQCVDPVFLLSKSEWIEKLKLKDMHETNYIMLYDFTHDDERIKTFALMLAKRKNLKIISINDFCNAPYADIQINNAGPKEFLQYMMNAEYVVANSFHATAFSLLFHKRFATFPLISQPNSARMIDLLDSVHLSGHFQPLDISEIDDFIDWNSIDDLIEQNAKYSKEYLKMALDS